MKAFIYGAGAQGRVVLDILKPSKYESIEFIDDNKRIWGKKFNGVLVVGGFQYLLKQKKKNISVNIALGNPKIKSLLEMKLSENKISLLNAIHSSSYIAKSAKIGNGDMIGANVVINSNSVVGNNVILNNLALIEHDCKISDFVNLSSAAVIGGRVKIKKGAFICMGAIVLPRVTIGEFSVVAAGTVVTKDVPNGVMVKGIPGRIAEKINNNFNWNRLL